MMKGRMTLHLMAYAAGCTQQAKYIRCDLKLGQRATCGHSEMKARWNAIMDPATQESTHLVELYIENLNGIG